MGVNIMSVDKRTIHGIDPYAPGGLSDLFAYHRGVFGDAVMEVDPDAAALAAAEAAAAAAREAAGGDPDWKALARKWEARAKENLAKVKELEPAQARLAEIESANQSELEKAIARAEKAEQEAADKAAALALKDREVLVREVAAEKKVPAKWLTGETREELEAAADEWLQDAQGIAPSRPGYVPSAGTGNGAGASTLDEVRERAKAFAGK